MGRDYRCSSCLRAKIFSVLARRGAGVIVVQLLHVVFQKRADYHTGAIPRRLGQERRQRLAGGIINLHLYAAGGRNGGGRQRFSVSPVEGCRPRHDVVPEAIPIRFDLRVRRQAAFLPHCR